MYLDTSNVQSLKEKLLLCAVNEFAEYGYEGARVDNIVKAAGCSKQTVYHHFGNKENLFIEVLEYTWNDIRQNKGIYSRCRKRTKRRTTSNDFKKSS